MKDHSYPDESNKPGQLKKAKGRAERGMHSPTDGMAGYYGTDGKRGGKKKKSMKMDY